MPHKPSAPSLLDKSFLSPSNYDDDASSIHSNRSDQDTDSEDDEVLIGARTSADIRAHDRGVLLEEEERDRLLEESRRNSQRRGSGLAAVSGGLRGLFARSHAELPGTGTWVREPGIEMEGKRGEGEKGEKGYKSKKRKRRSERRRQKRERLMNDGKAEVLMQELEEGGLKEGSTTGDSSETEGSDEVDRRGLLGMRDEKQKRRRRWLTWCMVHLTIAVGFSILVLLAWKLSRSRRMASLGNLASNGTAVFAPTTILVSLDGFRADFLKRNITPTLNGFIQKGVSPLYMNPSFPSVTFPNHYTLVTGLYPESHGVVGNTFWDDDLQEEFYYTHPLAMQPKWWGGEPLWVTAENQGIRTAIHMWPGSEAHIAGVEPAFLDKYNGKEPLQNKVNRILGLLDKPGQEDRLAEVVDMRPQLIAAYVPNVDADGHKYGPNSTEIRVTISDVDNMLSQLFRGLEERNLTKIVNVVVVSDHGMATTDTNRLIQLEDIIDTNLIEHTDGWPLYGLRPKNLDHLQSLYDTLKVEAAINPGFKVYLRDNDMPERYHFSKNERIAPLWMVPNTGWAIVTKSEFDVGKGKKEGLIYKPRGLHGYDHEHPLMRAIFVARGPAFPHAPNSRLEPFQNIEVYNILCDSLNIIPKPNNGTLRLPLKPVGLHTPEIELTKHPDPEPPSPLSSASLSSSAAAASTATPDSIISISPIEASLAADPNDMPPTTVGVDEPGQEISNNRPTVEDESTSDKDKDFLKWLHDQVDKMKGWIHGIVGNNKSGGSDDKGKGAS